MQQPFFAKTARHLQAGDNFSLLVESACVWGGEGGGSHSRKLIKERKASVTCLSAFLRMSTPFRSEHSACLDFEHLTHTHTHTHTHSHKQREGERQTHTQKEEM
mmetsp:Transcript_54317/g.106290  ORF Transcript_54317/g.106290 Transcript_54317/m.106290 type:complete len:104 (+) Transcript_54317:1045-1356(+)